MLLKPSHNLSLLHVVVEKLGKQMPGFKGDLKATGAAKPAGLVVADKSPLRDFSSSGKDYCTGVKLMATET
jgi:hypothetical protein